MDALYDIEDIYEWIDYVRRMGLDQGIFLVCNFVKIVWGLLFNEVKANTVIG